MLFGHILKFWHFLGHIRLSDTLQAVRHEISRPKTFANRFLTEFQEKSRIFRVSQWGTFCPPPVLKGLSVKSQSSKGGGGKGLLLTRPIRKYLFLLLPYQKKFETYMNSPHRIMENGQNFKIETQHQILPKDWCFPQFINILLVLPNMLQKPRQFMLYHIW